MSVDLRSVHYVPFVFSWKVIREATILLCTLYTLSILALCRLYFGVLQTLFSIVWTLFLYCLLFFGIVWTLVLHCAGFIVSVVVFIFALSLLELCIVCTCIVAYVFYCSVLCTCVVV